VERPWAIYPENDTTNKNTPELANRRPNLPVGYATIHKGIIELLNAARYAAARNVNALMTASYWEIGRRIVERQSSRANGGRVMGSN